MADVIGLDGKKILSDKPPEEETPTSYDWLFSTVVDAEAVQVHGVLGVNPLFVYIADESKEIVYLVTMDKLVSVERIENQE